MEKLSKRALVIRYGVVLPLALVAWAILGAINTGHEVAYRFRKRSAR